MTKLVIKKLPSIPLQPIDVHEYNYNRICNHDSVGPDLIRRFGRRELDASFYNRYSPASLRESAQHRVPVDLLGIGRGDSHIDQEPFIDLFKALNLEQLSEADHAGMAYGISDSPLSRFRLILA